MLHLLWLRQHIYAICNYKKMCQLWQTRMSKVFTVTAGNLSFRTGSIYWLVGLLCFWGEGVSISPGGSQWTVFCEGMVMKGEEFFWVLFWIFSGKWKQGICQPVIIYTESYDASDLEHRRCWKIFWVRNITPVFKEGLVFSQKSPSK